MTSQNQVIKSRNIDSTPATLPTFLDHVRELQGRLFAIAIVFLLMASAAYPFFDFIVNFLVAPLGNEHELVYLTPGGAFSFIIKVCMYVGAIGSLPFIIYHVYRFFLPAVRVVNIRRALAYTAASLFLALVGLSFAYFASLPAALYFLTSFNLHNINPMLTIDSYFSFIMTYMLAGALLFQLPLVINIINTIKPLDPGGMMKYQRHLIVGSFIVAAVISPTPDALNQIILALPVVLMYQLSMVTIWLSSRKRAKRRIGRLVYAQPIGKMAVKSYGSLSVQRRLPYVSPIPKIQPNRAMRQTGLAIRPRTSIDGFRHRPETEYAKVVTARQARTASARSIMTSSGLRPVRSIDGFMMPSRSL